MGNVLKVGNMWLFIPTGEPVHERPHVHFSRKGEDKRINIKVWLTPQIELAKKHKSFGASDVADALEAVQDNFKRCMKHWAEMYAETHKPR